MTDEAIQKDQWRQMLAPLVNKVPASINSASVQVVRDWKEKVVKARKAMDSRKTSLATLQTLYNQLSQYK
jgi:hypothetical protein